MYESSIIVLTGGTIGVSVGYFIAFCIAAQSAIFTSNPIVFFFPCSRT
jgi:ABC-type lipoprotein release transport system permease subunit